MPLKLIGIGLVAGLFSALFGVGGGIVIVPLLILLAGFEGRAATGTSLAAIGITALAGTILYAFEGHVHVAYAALVGLPAAAGAVAGTAVQQRVSGRALTLAFAALLADDRDLAARRMSATTVAFALLLGFTAGVLAGFFGVGGGILFVPTLVALGLSPARRRGDLAARDPADGRGRHLASTALRERPLADGARARNVLDRRCCRRRPGRNGAAGGHPAAALRALPADRRRTTRMAGAAASPVSLS